jgi:hypothetical protein
VADVGGIDDAGGGVGAAELGGVDPGAAVGVGDDVGAEAAVGVEAGAGTMGVEEPGVDVGRLDVVVGATSADQDCPVEPCGVSITGVAGACVTPEDVVAAAAEPDASEVGAGLTVGV